MWLNHMFILFKRIIKLQYKVKHIFKLSRDITCIFLICEIWNKELSFLYWNYLFINSIMIWYDMSCYLNKLLFDLFDNFFFVAYVFYSYYRVWTLIVPLFIVWINIMIEPLATVFNFFKHPAITVRCNMRL